MKASCISQVQQTPGGIHGYTVCRYSYRGCSSLCSSFTDATLSIFAQNHLLEAEAYLTAADGATRLSACLLYAYACLSMGRIGHAWHALGEIKRTLAIASDGETAPPLRTMEAFVAFAAAVLLHLPLPEEMPPTKDFLPLLPPGLRSFALYVQAHYLYLKGEYGHSAGIVEATLAMGADAYPISAIYLHLAAVMDYMSMKQPERAQAHLLAAHP